MVIRIGGDEEGDWAEYQEGTEALPRNLCYSVTTPISQSKGKSGRRY